MPTTLATLCPKSNTLTIEHNGTPCNLDEEADLPALRIATERVNRNGADHLVKSLQLRFQASEWATLETEVAPNDSNMLGEIEQRVLDAIVRRSWQMLERGGDIEGDGWSLNLIELTVLGNTPSTCPLEQVSAVTWDADQLCIWHEDSQQQVFARLPRESDNAVVLHRILDQLLNNVEPETEAAANTGMGKRVSVFETTHHVLPVKAMAITSGTVLALLGIFVSMQAAGMALLVILLLAFMFAPSSRGYQETLSHYDKGLVWSRGGEENVMLFDDVATFHLSELPESLNPKTGDAKAQLVCKAGRSDREIRMELAARDPSSLDALRRQAKALQVQLQAQTDAS